MRFASALDEVTKSSLVEGHRGRRGRARSEIGSIEGQSEADMILSHRVPWNQLQSSKLVPRLHQHPVP